MDGREFGAAGVADACTAGLEAAWGRASAVRSSRVSLPTESSPIPLADPDPPRANAHAAVAAAHEPHGPTPVGQLVTEFLRERNVPCPVCAYNLRNVVTGICPECGVTVAIHIHPRNVASGSSTAGMLGLVVGIVASLVAALLSVRHGTTAVVLSLLFLTAAIVQLSLWEQYFRRVRAQRRELLWVYTCSGWAIPAIIVLWLIIR